MRTERSAPLRPLPPPLTLTLPETGSTVLPRLRTGRTTARLATLAAPALRLILRAPELGLKRRLGIRR